MRAEAARRRGARAALALLVGLLVGGWAGGGLVWVLNRGKYRDPDKVADVSLARAEEVELVPADAMGFAHARLADLWKSDAGAEFRKVVQKAGPDALKALDEGFVPAPSTVDRATVVVMRGESPAPPPRDPKNDIAPPPGAEPGGGFGPPGPVRPPPEVFAILAFSAPFDADKVRQANLPNAQKKTANGKDYWQDERGGVAIHFPNDRLLVIGSGSAVGAFLAKESKKDGPLAPAIRLAAAGERHLVAAVNLTQFPVLGNLPVDLPGELGPVLRAESMTMGVVVGSGAKVDLRANFKSEDEAKKAEDAARGAAATGRKKLKEVKDRMEASVTGKPGDPKPRPVQQLPEAIGGLFALGAINMLDEWLADPPLKREGTELSATVTMPSLGASYATMSAASIGMLLPAVQKVRDAAARTADSNNLKQMGIAMHTFHDANGYLPPPSWGTKFENGRQTGTLSWRVAILPYIEEDVLYGQFRLDEPWDSEHNKKLIPMMPRVYMSPRAPTEPGMTYYKVFVGKIGRNLNPIFVPGGKARLTNIVDGTSNTIMIAEGGGPVTWTKPDDFEFDPKKPLPKLALPGTSGINVLMGDGSVRYIDLSGIPEANLKAAITANGGEVLDLDLNKAGGGAFIPIPNVGVPNEAPLPKAPGALRPKGPIKLP